MESPVMHSYGRWQNGAENGELFLPGLLYIRVPSSILMSVTFDPDEGGRGGGITPYMYSQDIIELYQNGVQIAFIPAYYTNS